MLALQLAVKRGPVGLGATAVALLGADRGEEQRLQRGIAQLGRQRPARARRRRAASTSAGRSMALPRPDGQSRCCQPRRSSTEARRAPGASRSSLLASSPPVAKPKERTLSGPAETPPIRATSSRNGGRNDLGTLSEITSEWWATSSRIHGRLPPEYAAENLSRTKTRSACSSDMRATDASVSVLAAAVRRK